MAATLEQLQDDELKGVLQVLRRARGRMSKIVGDVSGGERDLPYDVVTALKKKQALEREIAAVEQELGVRAGHIAQRSAVAAVERDGARTGITGVTVDAAVVARAQANAAREVRDVGAAVRRELNRAVVDGLTGAKDRGQVDAAIAKAIDADVMDARVERIVRTEVGEALMQQQAANDELLAEEGVDLIKRWKVADHTQRTRPEHLAIEGQERELDQPFHMGDGATADTPPDAGVGIPANAPLDPSLPAHLRIQCRCTYVRVPRSQAVKSYIAKENPRAALAATATAASDDVVARPAVRVAASDSQSTR